MNAVWLGSLTVIVGTLVLRLAGRRSISQMTFGSVLVMLSLGTIFAEPIARRSPWITFMVVVAMLVTLAILEWLEVKFDRAERILAGKAMLVIEDGVIQETNLRKLRMTVDKLEMRLRQKGIKHLSDIKTATIEANGELGYELQPHMEPLTVGQFESVMSKLIPEIVHAASARTETNLFDEIEHRSANHAHPERLN